MASAVTSVEYKYNLGEIQNASIVEKKSENGALYNLLCVANEHNTEFFLDIKKFLPERSIPKFKFQQRYTEITNSNIWGTSIFWVYDGMMCVKDIVRFSNMSIKEAVLYYGEDQVSNIFPLDHKVCRTELISTSLKTLD